MCGLTEAPISPGAMVWDFHATDCIISSTSVAVLADHANIRDEQHGIPKRSIQQEAIYSILRLDVFPVS